MRYGKADPLGTRILHIVFNILGPSPQTCRQFSVICDKEGVVGMTFNQGEVWIFQSG